MPKKRDAYHPNAYLSQKNNISVGLTARTKVLRVLEGRENTTREISFMCRMTYPSTIYHLRLLEREKIVMRTGTKPFRWKVTGLGQQRLSEGNE